MWAGVAVVVSSGANMSAGVVLFTVFAVIFVSIQRHRERSIIFFCSDSPLPYLIYLVLLFSFSVAPLQ